MRSRPPLFVAIGLGLALGAAVAAAPALAEDPRPEILLAPLDRDPLPPSSDQAAPVNYLAKCLANPDDPIACEIARSAATDGGLESAVTGQMQTGAYVTCPVERGICLELATLDLGEGSDKVAAVERMPAVDIAIAFAYDSAVIAPTEAGKLIQLASALRDSANAGASFAVVGHTDAKGSDAYNCRLSRARAEAVATRLATLKVEPGRLSVIGAGEHVHRNEADGEAAENRRVGFARLGPDAEPMVQRLAALCRG